DIVKRPYITMGMLGLLSLTPLAATSTAGMIKRLGARRWRRLHRLAYLAGVAGCVHFLWLAKVGRTDQYWYVATLVLLLSILLGDVCRAAEADPRGPAERGRADRPGAPRQRRRGGAALDADGRPRRGPRRARARALHRAHDLQGHANATARVDRSHDRGVRRDEQRVHLVRHDALRLRRTGQAPSRDGRAPRGPRRQRELPSRRDRKREEGRLRGDEPRRRRPGQVPPAPPLRGGVLAAPVRPADPRHARVHRAPAARPPACVLSEVLRTEEHGGGRHRRREARGGPVRCGRGLWEDPVAAGRPARAAAAARDRREPARGCLAPREAGVPRPRVEDGADR